MRILITGASGSGTTTLGKYLSMQLGWAVLDADDYFWLPANPPYQKQRDEVSRLKMMQENLSKHKDTIISGSITGWNCELEDSFDLVVFLYLETSIRVDRLKLREERELGSADPAFLKWASEYDIGPNEGRSFAKHNNWLKQRQCKVLRIEGDLTIAQRSSKVISLIETL